MGPSPTFSWIRCIAARRPLLLHTDRNGFFYVLDRTNGKLLLAKPFLRRVDWAKSIDDAGRPVVVEPHGCPSDAANWDATAYSPKTRLYFCSRSRNARASLPAIRTRPGRDSSAL